MKRLLPVLALALILILMSWGEASSNALVPMRRYIIYYDHPWGGDYKEGPFVGLSASSEPQNDFTGEVTFRSWLNSWYYFSLLYLGISRNETTTPSTTQSGFRGYNPGFLQEGVEK